MKLKRIELVIIALTLAFACFTGGFFTGRRSRSGVIEIRQDGAPDAVLSAGAVSQGDAAAVMPQYAATDPEEIPVQVQPEEETGSAAEEETGILEETPPGDTREIVSLEPEQVPEAVEESPDTSRVADYDRININTATRGELTDLSGIGDVLAGRIIEYREKQGGFKNIEEIKKVSGIGEKKFEAIKEYIYTG